MLRKTIVRLDEQNREIERHYEYCDDPAKVGDWIKQAFGWDLQWQIDCVLDDPDAKTIQIFLDVVKDNGCIASSVQIF